MFNIYKIAQKLLLRTDRSAMIGAHDVYRWDLFKKSLVVSHV